MTLNWNQHQQAIFEATGNTTDSLVVKALAGTGKTTTIVEALKYLPTGKKALLCAFNKLIQKELEARAPEGVTVKTLHGVGFTTCRKRIQFQVDGDKVPNALPNMIRNIMQDRAAANKPQLNEAFGEKDFWGMVGPVSRVVGLCKNLLVPAAAHTTIESVAIDYGAVDDEDLARDVADVVSVMLQWCENETSTIDFDDMIWLPAVKGWKPVTYDVVIIDEAQDVNPAQLYLIKNSMKRKGSRLIAVGDDNQAIYSWRGAGAGVLNDLVEEFNATVFDLPVTYRCGKAIVQAAQKYVPAYQAADTNAAGKVRSVSMADLIPSEGDFVLSRKNAPLISICLQLLREGRPAVIRGRDITTVLRQLIKKSKRQTVDELMAYLTEHYARMEKKWTDKRPERLELLADQIACLRALADGCDTIGCITRRMDRMFADRTPEQMIVLSSVHKAKGLERERVWLLEDTFANFSQEEINITYVAVTRAKSELIWVTSPKGD